MHSAAIAPAAIEIKYAQVAQVAGNRNPTPLD